MLPFQGSGRSPRRKRRPLAGLCLALLAAGCTVGPDYRTPEVAVPAAWGSAGVDIPAAAPRLAQWWQRLGDPQLDALVEEAVVGNLDVATAKARIREARAGFRQAGGALYPTVEGSGSATRTRDGVQKKGTEVSSHFQAGFDASWELDLFGGNGRRLEAAGYGLQAAEQELRATLLTLVGDVATNYVTARGLRRIPAQAHAILHRACRLAVMWGWLPLNPCDRVLPPKYRATLKKV